MNNEDSPEMTFAVRVLGPLEVRSGSDLLEVGGPKPRLLLALLLTNAGSVVSVDSLLGALWGDEPPETGKKAVQVHVSNLRRALGPDFPLNTAPGGYTVNPNGLDLDAARFEADVEAASTVLRTNPAMAVERFGRALATWSGSPYSDLAGEQAIEPEIARLSELRVLAVEQRLDAMLRLGRHADVLGELETLTIEHPYRERLRALQMLALYRSGRQTDALRAFQRTRETLGEELGIEPSAELRALEQQILEQSTDLDLSEDVFSERFAFLFTDIEDSTAMWESEPEEMQVALADHDRLLAQAVAEHDGSVFKGTGDGVLAVFEATGNAVDAAVTAQRLLAAQRWATSRPVRVRMAVDEGAASARSGDYFGPVLNRVARVMSAGHGGQVLIAEQAARHAGVTTTNLGSADFKGVGRIEVHQIVADGLGTDFPELRTDRSPTAGLRQGFGQAIRGYEIRERLGEGAHGIVYRAYQASVGREVAVKVIRPELANQASFVKRFEAEAQYVAQLEHPHIVSLYDYWRDPEGAYLAMQWLRGGSLADSIEKADWKPPAALHLLDQLGQALNYAHRHGVIHRDLKPANVLLDEEGNGFLTDFGIAAQHIEAVGGPVASSVAYLAPEELAGTEIGAAADQYGLALLTFELFTGTRPELGGQPGSITELRPDLPAAIDPIIARATDRDPQARFARIEDYLRALRQAFGADVVTRRSADAEIRNPYKGLRAFAETDANDFHGREELLGRLLDLVTANRLTAVIGPSGSGKSSLVRAGLVPAARRGEVGGSNLVIAEMFPGSYPFEELEAALVRVAVERPEGLLDELRSDDRGLLRATKQLLPEESELLLVVDQFEELFSLTADDAARRMFLSSLLTAAGDARSRIRIVLTMRADFFDRPLAYADFGTRMQTSMLAVTTPTDLELAAAVVQPARAVGLDVEDGLVARILRDVADEPGALPLLQYALTELVDQRDSDQLSIAAYERSGGVGGAVAARAEEIFQAMSPAVQAAANEFFVRLVTVGDDAEDTRKRTRVSDLHAIGLSETAVESVMNEYGSFRLLSFDHDPVTRGPTVEVAHEALIREWPRYREWIDERREDLLIERRLGLAAAEWAESGRNDDYLLRAGRLNQYEEWVRTSELAVSPVEREFIDRSRTAADDDEASGRRRRTLVLAGVAVLALVGFVLAGIALVQRDRAEDQSALAENEATRAAEAAASADAAARAADAAATEAEALRADAERRADAEVARSLNLQAMAAVESNPELALLLADEAAAAEAALGRDGSGATDALVAAARADRLVHRLEVDPIFPEAGFIGAVSPDSRHFASWSGANNEDVIVYDIATGEERWTASLPDAPLGFIDWDEATGELVLSSRFGSATTWDAESGTLLTEELVAPAPMFRQVSEGLRIDMVVANLEEILSGEATLSRLATAVIDRASGDTLLELPEVVAALSSPDDRRLAVWTFDGTIDVYDLETGERTASVDKGTVFDLNDIVWRTDSQALWWIEGDTRLLTIDANDGTTAIVSELDDVVSPLGLRARPTGDLLAIISAAGSVDVIDTERFDTVATLRGHETTVSALAWSPDGRHLLSSAPGEGAIAWDLSGRHGLREDLWVPRAFYPDSAAVLENDRLLVADGAGRAQIVDVNSGATVAESTSPLDVGRIGAIASGDGAKVATSYGLGLRTIGADGNVELELDDLGLDQPLAFSKDGDVLVASTSGRSLANGFVPASRVGIVDTTDGTILHEFGNLFAEAADVTDTLVIVSGQERFTSGLAEPHVLALIDRATGDRLATHTLDVRCTTDLEVAPGSAHLVVAGCDGELISYTIGALLEDSVAVPVAALPADGREQTLVIRWLDSERFVTGGFDRRVSAHSLDLAPLWSFDAGIIVSTLVVQGDVVYFPAADTEAGFGLVGVPTSIDELRNHVRSLTTRQLTSVECDLHGVPSC